MESNQTRVLGWRPAEWLLRFTLESDATVVVDGAEFGDRIVFSRSGQAVGDPVSGVATLEGVEFHFTPEEVETWSGLGVTHARLVSGNTVLFAGKATFESPDSGVSARGSFTRYVAGEGLSSGAGTGVPEGGHAGEALLKSSGDDYEVEWGKVLLPPDSPADGDVLVYDAGSGKWVSGEAPTGGGGVVTVKHDGATHTTDADGNTIYFDTGWRDVRSLIFPDVSDAMPAGIRLRRENGLVHINLPVLWDYASQSHVWMSVLEFPEGFTPLYAAEGVSISRSGINGGVWQWRNYSSPFDPPTLQAMYDGGQDSLVIAVAVPAEAALPDIYNLPGIQG